MGRQNELALLLGRVPKRATYRKYLIASYSKNTKAAYETDMRHFKQWGGRIPSMPMQVARYLAAYAGKLAFATLSRRLAAIHREHEARGYRSPARTELVRATLRGIGRTYSRRQRQVRPLLRGHLLKMLPYMRSARGLRDKALLLVGFLGGFRRSEIAALNLEDVEISRWGATITLKQSKTDQDGVGRAVKIPRLKGALCAVRGLERWLALRGRAPGPLFTTLTPHGTPSHQRIYGALVADAVKRRTAQIGLDARDFSGHSLRAGFVTSAALAGASVWQIKQQTGHKSDATVARYIRTGATAGAGVAKLVGSR